MRSARCLIAAAVVATVSSVALLAGGATGHAGIIISDGFSVSPTTGTALGGRTPDTADRPGSTYVTTTNSSNQAVIVTTSSGTPGAYVNTATNTTVEISIASDASYAKPTLLTISAEISLGGDTIIPSGSSQYARGVGLGFYTQAPNGVESSSYFTGLAVNDGTGDLRLVENANATGTGGTTTYAGPFVGFSASTFYALSYTINTTTGGITNVMFNGNNYTSAFAGVTAFSNANTNIAGFYGDGESYQQGLVANFQVQGADVPEPSALRMIFIAGVSLLLLGRGKRGAGMAARVPS
jgi:hypothetical protein